MNNKIPALPGEFGVAELLVEVQFKGESLRVFKLSDGRYDVMRGDVVRHPKCTADDAIRAMGFYLSGSEAQ